MLVVDDISSTIARAPNAALDDMSRKIWSAYADGDISEAQADAASREIHARRQQLAQKRAQPAQAKRPVRRCPDRAGRIDRRRRQAASGAVPATLAAAFTGGELATLAVVGRQAASGRPCDWPMARIAALAGVSVSTARNALRMAQRLGMVRVIERRRAANRSLTNLISITCRKWMGWLRRGRKEGGGSKKPEPMNTEVILAARQPVSTGKNAGEIDMRMQAGIVVPSG